MNLLSVHFQSQDGYNSIFRAGMHPTLLGLSARPRGRRPGSIDTLFMSRLVLLAVGIALKCCSDNPYIKNENSDDFSEENKYGRVKDHGHKRDNGDK